MSGDERSLEQQRLDLERQKQADDVALARDRLAVEKRQAGRFSTAQVTVITLVVSGLLSLVTATVSGLFGVQTTQATSQGQLDIKRTEVEGQLVVQNLIAEAERDRLAAQQSFEIIVQATKGLPPETAARNLLFFVEAGILPDPDGHIKRLAERGEAPDLPAAPGRPVNPILSRLESAASPALVATGTGEAVRVEHGLLLGSAEVPVRHIETPNLAEGNRPRYVILSYTAGPARSLPNWLSNPEARSSPHLLIARDGSVTQFVPFDYKAWHAGRSQWGALNGLNGYSIGITLENMGRVSRASDGTWRGPSNIPVPESEVVVMQHRFGGSESGWHTYTPEQLAALQAVMAAIREAHPEVVDLIGQDEVVVPRGRKEAPGPAFPLEDIREATFGRREALEPPA